MPCPEYHHWQVADRLIRAAGVRYQLSSRMAQHQLVRLIATAMRLATADQVARVADTLILEADVPCGDSDTEAAQHLLVRLVIDACRPLSAAENLAKFGPPLDAAPADNPPNDAQLSAPGELEEL
jgi:hypothetical protein